MADITNFNIGQGESFKILIQISNEYRVSGSVVPQDLTDYTFSGTIRESYSSDYVAANFNFETVLPATSGSVFVSLTPQQTSALNQRKYVYDINMVSGSSYVRRILEGAFMIRPASTR
jgi:hypothetical protein